MWRISPIAVDWVEKGFHLHLNGVELLMHPDHTGWGVTFESFFSSTPRKRAEEAIVAAKELLEDDRFLKKALRTAEKAVAYLAQFEGDLRPVALARAGELNFLRIVLARLEKTDGDA